MKTIKIVDPPSGWAYGFPKPLPDDVTDLEKWLIEQGYPEEDAEFGARYCRYWIEEVGEDYDEE